MKIKTQISKQILSVVLALVMVLSMLPVTGLMAFAADTDTGKAIQFGTSVIADGDKANNKWDYVYYGTYNNSPIKWRVLSKNGNGGTYTDNDGNAVTAPIFLLSEYVLKLIRFKSGNSNKWQNSDAQAWCRDDFAGNSFSDAEKKYVLKTTKTDAAETLFGILWGTSELQDDTAFFISAKEASLYLGSNEGDEGLKADKDWWLRSPTGSSYAGYVTLYGDITKGSPASTYGARPAFNLNPSSVLFTSAAEGGKPEAFVEVAAYSGNEWKLTLKDDSRDAFEAMLSSISNNTVTVSYSGANTGDNEYISAIIKNGDTVKYYGRLGLASESGTETVTLPDDFNAANGDVLCIFNEQYNGDYKTDYASELKEMPICEVAFDANGGTGTMDSVIVKSGETYTLPTNDFTALSGYQFKGWATTKDGTVITDAKITVTADTTLYAIWEMIPAEAPTVTPGDDLTITYNGYTDAQISVSVNEQTDYTYSYQWYDGDGQLIDGAINSIYTVPNDLAADSYSYYCRVTAKRIDNELTNFTDSAEITVTVNKATPDVTAPTAKENLEFNGSEQELISAGSTTNGTMQYALGTAEAVTGEWKNDIPKATKAGTYYVWYKVVGNENYNDVDPAHITVTINKATPGVTAPTAKENLEYNGAEQELINAGSATNGIMQYALGTNGTTVPTEGWSTVIPEAKNADTYYVWYRVVGNDNYNDVDPVCITVTVAKVKITVTADDKFKTYGSADPALTWSITSGALAPNDSLTGISLSRATGEDAGQYTITVSQAAGSNPNYDITLVNGTFTITQKAINVSWSNTEFTYDGTAHKPAATTSDFVANDDVALTVSGEQTNAGVDDYTATVTITGTKAGNYKFADGAATTTKFTIKKADQDKPAAIASSNETISGKRDGYFTGVDTTMEYRKDGETDYNPITGDKVENLAAGKYFVRVMGKENYNPSADTEVIITAGRKLTVTVPSAAEQVGYALVANETELDWQGGFVLTYRLLAGYTETEDFAIKVNGEKITLTDGTYTQTGVETDVAITVEGIIADTTAPEAEISISTNKWTQFLNTISFGLFFNETETITITATDEGGGVDKIYFLISETGLTEDEVKALASDKWTEYDAANKPCIDFDSKCIVYAKVIDKAQNVKYISSDGLVFDGTAPVIRGIENGRDYYGDVTFTATDALAGVKEIKVDGNAVTLTEGNYTITADNAEHTVTVTDNAGNTTEWKITVYKKYTVTFIVDGETLTTKIVNHNADAEMPEIPAKRGYTAVWDKDGKAITADTTITAVYTVNKFTGTENTEKVKDITSENVKPEDKTDLEKAKEDLEDALENNGDNYTEDEKKAIQEEIDRIDEALDVIDRVEKVEQQIENLPDTITKDDTNDVDAAKKAYDELSDYEKTLIDPVVKAKLDDAVKAAEDVNKPADTNSPQTGDNTNLWLWIALLFVSGGAVITLTVVDRKRRTVNR